MSSADEQRELLALCRVQGVDWHLLAREAQRPDGLTRLLDYTFTEVTKQSEEARQLIKAAESSREVRLAGVDAEIERAAAAGARLVTVLDEDYPRTLRLIYNLPPFLFIRGSFSEKDLRSVAVVGTRQASNEGREQAGRLAEQLVQAGVTVVSGLARGIDTAAHSAALASGGRTIAVVGTGITRCYPAENKELCEAVAQSGAVVSQFWPSAPPARYTFPRRNVTMSGIAQGTVVVEASSTSGAKMQARFALEHGKKVFLLHSLVSEHSWAAKYVAGRGAHVVDSVEDVLSELASPEDIHDDDVRRVQLSLL